MKNPKKYIAWIMLGILVGFGLVMFGRELSNPPLFEMFNKGEIVCFHTKEAMCYKLITIK